jgi:Sulfatase
LKTFRSGSKTFLQCLGFSSLALLANYADLLGGGSNKRMHAPLALTGICLAQIADIALLCIGLFLVLALLRRTPLYPLIQLLIAIAAPPFLLWRAKPLLPFTLSHSTELALAGTWTVLVLLMLMRVTSPWYRQTIRCASGIGASFGIFAILSILQLLLLTVWKPGPQEHTAVWATATQPPRQHPLLVWIVFDELSYDQSFEHRAHDLKLPRFDALRAQSTLFTDVQPAGYKTVKVIPSLLSGQNITDLRYDLHNSLLIHTTGKPGFHRLTGSETVFADAQQNGWRTAAVGWYNPYCSLYAGTIDDCYWTDWDTIDGPMAQREGLWNNILTPLQQLAHKSLGQRGADHDLCNYDVRHHYQTHMDLEQHAMQVLRTDQADFIFLHLAVPHSPNIWSRMNDTYVQQCDSSYLDSLALADHELGKITSILESSPRWKNTTLIVEGDHSWRIELWNDSPAWTEEDDAASHGVFDPRPALLIHQPGQTQALTNATAWPLLRVHDVVDEVLRGNAVHY